MKPWSTPALLISLTSIAGLSGYWIGHQTDDARSSAPQDDVFRRAYVRPTTAHDENHPTNSLASSMRRQERNNAGNPSLTLNRMHDVMQIGDTQDRTHAWLDFIDRLPPAQFESVVADFRALGMSLTNSSEYTMLLSSWAKHDPQAAIDYAEKNTGNAIARQTVLATWAANDPSAAIAWANSHFQGAPDQGNPWMTAVIRGLASTDPAQAMQLVQEMPSSRARNDALTAMMPTILTQGIDSAKSWIASFKDPVMQEDAMRQLAPRLAEKDPLVAAEWLATSPTAAANQSIGNVMATWMKANPDAALAYYPSLPSSELRTNALGGLVGPLAAQDPRQAAVFLSRHSADANDDIYQQFARQAVDVDPTLAADHIGRIQDAKGRDRTYGRVIGRWMRRDPSAAQAWLSQANLSAEAVAQIQKAAAR